MSVRVLRARGPTTVAISSKPLPSTAGIWVVWVISGCSAGITSRVGIHCFSLDVLPPTTQSRIIGFGLNRYTWTWVGSSSLNFSIPYM